MTEVLGFNRASIMVEKDSRELLFIKRIRWAVKHLWTLERYLRSELNQEIRKIYSSGHSVGTNEAKRLLRLVYFDCKVSGYVSSTKNVNWLQTLKHLNDALTPV